MRLRLLITAVSLGIAACSPASSPRPPAERIPETLSVHELGELDSEAIVATSYSLRPAGRSRLGGDAIGVSVVLVNRTNAVVTNPICYLFFDARNIRLIELEGSSEIAPGGQAFSRSASPLAFCCA